MPADASSGGGDHSPEPPTDRPVLLFDGVCNLCNTLVQFIIEHDPEGHFRFASLQSSAARALLEQFDLPTDEFDTFVLVEGDEYFTRSTAALKVARHLGLPWSLLAILLSVPRPVRDLGYDLVANSRYRVFGRRDRCLRPTADQRERFLENGSGPTDNTDDDTAG